ncbi:MAG TPA: hypothetical protein HPP94_08255 [Desulfuromonadales bacterium]|nr:hypothetical protein [Desulfuromonadales bacterium]
MPRQSCAVCAWRENCSKRFCIPDGGARCPDFTRDVSIKETAEDSDHPTDQKEQSKK